MFNKSKKFLSLLLCVLMCISMLTAIVLPASAETSGEGEATEDPYAAIQATENADGTFTPTKGVFVYAGAPTSGDVTYTYGDGETWGNGLTYKLVGGKTAFSSMNAAIHYVETQWNAHAGPYTAYTGPDTVVVAPGQYGGSSWQNNKQITMNLPRDASGNTIENPAYYELFTYTVLGPQAGKDPTPTAKEDIANGTLINGRGVSTKTEAVSTSTLWMPQNAQIIVDGFAFRGSHNFHGSSSKVSLIMKNIVHKYDEIYSNGLYRWNTPKNNVNVEFHNYAMEYTQISDGTKKDNLGNFNMNVTRVVFDNYYEYGGNLKFVSDQYNQAHMINFYPTTTANIQENFLGPDNKTASFTMINSTLSHNRTAHWIRTRLGDNADVPTRVYSTNAKDSIKFVVKDNYFYNAGDYVGTDYKTPGTPAADPANVVDVFSFQDKWSLPDGALEFAFEGNTMEYTADCLARHSGGSQNGIIYLNGTNNDITKQNWWLKNNTMVLPIHACTDTIAWSENAQYFDRSSTLVLSPEGEVMAAAMKSNDDQINDVYAGDDFQGGIAEMFSLKTATDMAFNCTVNSTLPNSCSPAPVTADVYIVPYAAEKTHAAKDLFTFRGEKVEFVTLLDKAGNELTEAKPSELDGAKMIARYKGKTTTCTVTFNIKVATEDQMVFIDTANSATSYTFNGKTYALSASNRVGTFKDALTKKKPFWVLLPGTHKFVGGNEDRLYVASATILGPKMGVSPLNENNELDFSKRGVSGAGAPYTVDTTVEAVVGGAVTNYGPQNRLMLDGVVCDSTFQFSPSDADYTWGYAVGGALIGQDMNNVIVNDVCNNNMIVGLSSGEALQKSKAKRYFNASNTAFCNVGGGCIVSSGLYDINFDHIYAAGGTGEIIRTRMPSGIHMFMSPMTCGITITNSRIENWGTTTGNWIYPNYVDPTLGDTWGLSAYCNGENFPAGIRYVFDNNVFENIGKAGCSTKGYALRLAVPAAMDNFGLTFTNNTVTEDNMTGYRFIDLCSVSKEPGAYIKEENIDISGNTFINFSEPIRLSSFNGKGPKSDVISLDENFFAKEEGGVVSASPITAKLTNFVSKSDWYYMNPERTVKDTQYGMSFANVSNDFEVTTFPDFTANAKLVCGLAEIDPLQITPKDGMLFEGFYADKACTEPLTGSVNNNTIYAKATVDGVAVVYTINLTKAAAHNWSEYVTTVEPGCTTDGTAVRVCANCSTEESKVVPALGHVESEPTYVAATCTENAGIYIMCVRCEEQISGTEIPDSALGHDWGDWEITTVGSCTVDEVQSRTCDRCGEVDSVVTTAPGHDWSEWETTIAPTCTEEGEQIRTCPVCSAVETLTVAATGHTYETVVTDPTCVDDGKEEQICKICGYVDESVTVVLPATGIHTWGNYIVKEPTCSQQGVSERFCTVCSALDTETRVTEPVDPENHAFDPEGEDYELADAGDCENPAIYERTCPDCGEVDSYEDYDKVCGYHPYELKVTPASYDASGKYEKYCPECGDTELIQIVARLPKFSDADNKAWYAETLSKAAAMGLLQGYEDGTVRPNAFITRAEAVSMIARLAGVKTAKYSTNKFVDVAKNAWYNGAVAWAETNKIVSGRSENTFAPTSNITRQELCTVLMRYADFADVELNIKLDKVKFADDAKIAKYARTSVYLCQRTGLVSGRPGNLFAPTAFATRAEVARILVVFAEEYGLTVTAETAAKKLAIEVENARHEAVAGPLEADISIWTADLNVILEAAGIKAEDLKTCEEYEDAIVAKEYDLADLELAIKNLPDGAEKDQKLDQVKDLEKEITDLEDLYAASAIAESIALAEEELAAENKLHAENLKAIQ